MEFFISEQQLRILLHEGKKDNFNSNMKQLYSFVSDILQKVRAKYNLNLKLLLTWGASVGGLVLPLDKFIRDNEFNLDENQRALILVGLASILFYNNKRVFEKVAKKIEQEGLMETFKTILEKALKLKESFVNFMKSLNVSITSVSELISYAFLIPIIADIQQITAGQDINEAAKLIATRLFASGAVLVSSEALTEVIKKIVKRLKEL